jgi:transcriptional antiterminator RfaH
LAQFKPKCHRIAERNLERQGFQSFLPMQEETRRVRGKFTALMRPLFPGYLFVAFDKARGGWQAVNSTYGITRLVSTAYSGGSGHPFRQHPATCSGVSGHL